MAKIKMAGKQDSVAHESIQKGWIDYNNNPCALARCLSVARVARVWRMVAPIPQARPSGSGLLRQIRRRVDADAKVGHPLILVELT
jgi:hypothetical protein